MNSPILDRHPLDHPGVVKLLLSAAASEAISKAGKHHLAITAPADSTAPPEGQGRMILHVIATDKDTLDLAFGVIRGTHRAVKLRTTSKL